MKTFFLDLPDIPPEEADVLLVPLPYEGSVSCGAGTSRAPEAIWDASAEIELWDEELEYDLSLLKFSAMQPVNPAATDLPEDYLRRIGKEVTGHLHPALLPVGIGGDHSVTTPLVLAAARGDDLSDVTVIQFDAHADLRDEYLGSKQSHACVMHRLVERGARVIAIGIRSAEREEFRFGEKSGRVETFMAQGLAQQSSIREALLQRLRALEGSVYITFDIDALEVSLCPGTGTPQPGGLSWWQALSYLRALLHENRRRRLIGFDMVEVVPQPHSQVNEMVAARLIAKMIAYAFSDTDLTGFRS